MLAEGRGPAPLGEKGPPAQSNVLKELASLKFDKKNKRQPRLPPSATIQRRPLNHAPVASPYAGAGVQKVVYVSRNTPIMAAVKRVKKLLSHVEKRAMQDVDLMNDRNGMRKLAEASEKLAKEGEEVVVMASGRAMTQALKIAEWFRTREQEVSCKVEVRTGSVQAVDDIVEVEADETKDVAEETALEKMELESTELQGSGADAEDPVAGPEDDSGVEEMKDRTKGSTELHGKSRRRRKRTRPEYDKDDLPEARVRWIKTIEVAISLKG